MPPQKAPATSESANHSHALGKFTLHPPSLTSPTSPLTQCLANSSPLNLTALNALRSTLIGSRILAAERLSICDSNRRTLLERQASDKRAIDEGAKLKELERKRKREEEEKRERDRADKSERERLEKEKEEMAIQRKQEEIYEKARLKKEEDKRVADELERAKAVKKAIEEKEKKKVEQVLELVRVNEAQRIIETPSIAISEGTESLSPRDVSMADISTEDVDLLKKELIGEVTSTSTPLLEISSKSKSISSSIADSLDVKPLINDSTSTLHSRGLLLNS